MIRLAKYDDLISIRKVYNFGKQIMIDNGNPTQWDGNYPSDELLTGDIEKGNLYVYEEDNTIHGVFAFIIGADPTYSYIEGEWLNDNEYGTIHRIASDGKVKDIFGKSIEYCSNRINNLRIDTHHDNTIMQHLCIKNGFTECGVIYVEDGSARLAYQRVK